MGCDQLPGLERHRPADLPRWALYPLWTQAFLHDLRGAVYHLLAALRLAAHPSFFDPWRASPRPLVAAGLAPSEQAILADTVSGGTTRTGIRPLRHGGGGRAGDRTDFGRVITDNFNCTGLSLSTAHRHQSPLCSANRMVEILP